ncbi:hypothetical protein Pdw03_8032 [Penicillium digitatum]|uniref:Uncharacterized protein n=1 Tax=Penicillium digitatum TaxID=36651 RepID=A0A7T7BLG1_PENDI|nr:hypothetical protein Pdw03_8032 [Penicillium digitatum]
MLVTAPLHCNQGEAQATFGSHPIFQFPIFFLPSPSSCFDVPDLSSVYLAVHSCTRYSRRSPHLSIVGLTKLGDERRHSSGHSFCCHFLHIHFSRSLDFRIFLRITLLITPPTRFLRHLPNGPVLSLWA